MRWIGGLWRDLADEDGDGHFLAAIDGEANFVFAGPGDLEVLDIHDDGGTGGGGAGGDLDINLLRRRRGLQGGAVGINDGKFYFFNAFLDFLKAEFADDVTIDADGKLGKQDNVSGAEDVEFALSAGPGGEAQGEDFGCHTGRVGEKGKRKKEKVAKRQTGLLCRNHGQ